MDKFRKETNAFNFVYEKKLAKNETAIVKMPVVSTNKRSVNEIGWQTDGNVTLYGTLSSKPEGVNALWQEIKENDAINKTVSAIKAVNSGAACNIVIRVIMC